MIDFFVLLLALTGATWATGWWGILLIALVWGWWRRSRPAWIAAFAAAGAWGFWLALSGAAPVTLMLVDRLSSTLGVPGLVIVALPLLYAALLAGTAARLVQGFRRGGG